MKDVINTISDRIKSPIFGPILFSFIALNWKGLYYLLFPTSLPIEDRLNSFEQSTSIHTLISQPLVLGFAIALATPFLIEFIASINIFAKNYFRRIRAQSELDHQYAITEKRKSAELREQKLETLNSRSLNWLADRKESLTNLEGKKESLEIIDNEIKQSLSMLEASGIKTDEMKYVLSKPSLHTNEERFQYAFAKLISVQKDAANQVMDEISDLRSEIEEEDLVDPFPSRF